MTNLFPEIYVTLINKYFSFLSAFSPKKLLNIQRYKPRMGIGNKYIFKFYNQYLRAFQIIH